MPLSVTVKVQMRLPPALPRGVVDRLHDQPHRAAVGEFHRVAQQVQQDLAQPVRVTHDEAAGGGRNAGLQFQPLLLGGEADDGDAAVGEIVQPEGDGDQIEAPGLQLRQVEHVVDDGQQRPPGVAHLRGVAPLFRGQRGFQQHFREPDHAVHRRADLVAHRRQELLLGAAAGPRLLHGGAQFLFALLQPARHVVEGVGDDAEFIGRALGLDHRAAAAVADAGGSGSQFPDPAQDRGAQQRPQRGDADQPGDGQQAEALPQVAPRLRDDRGGRHADGEDGVGLVRMAEGPQPAAVVGALAVEDAVALAQHALDMRHLADIAVQPPFGVGLTGDDHAVAVQHHHAGVGLLQHLHQVGQPGEVDRDAHDADDPPVLDDRAGDDDQRLQGAFADDEVADHPAFGVEHALEILALAQRDAGAGAGGVADDVAVGVGQPDTGGPTVLTRHRRQGGGTRAGVPNPPDALPWSAVSFVIGGYTHGAFFVDSNGFVMTDGTAGVNTQWFLTFPPNGTSASFAPYLPSQTTPQPYTFDCFRCHTTGPQSQDPNHPLSQESRPGIQGTWAETAVLCEACHGPGSKHPPDPQARMMFVDSTPRTCARCHTAGDDPNVIVAANWYINPNTQYAELLASGGHSTFNCTVCHDPHASTAYEPGQGVINQCITCHATQNMAFHAGKVFVRGDYVESLTCQSCHMTYAGQSNSAATTAIVGSTGARMGDVRSHIFRVDTQNSFFTQMFSPDGTFVVKDAQGRAAVTPDFVCMRCHNGVGNVFELTATGANQIIQDMHRHAQTAN